MSDIRFRFDCRSDSMVENTGALVGPLDGSIVITSRIFDITHPLPGNSVLRTKFLRMSWQLVIRGCTPVAYLFRVER